MKIKRKVQMNLPQLIEYAWENNVIDKNLLADDNVTPLRITIGGEFIFDNDYIYSKHHTFTIEVEEEITEDTVFNYLLLTYKKDNDKIETHWYEDKCKKSVLSQSDRLMYVSEQLSITYFDDKGIPHLIWTHEKGMVE